MLEATCCCGEAIGFDQAAWTIGHGCFPDRQLFGFLKDSPDQLTNCKVLFAGLDGVCGNAVKFAAGDWPKVHDYITSGGRMWLQSEYSGCLGDAANLAAFLSAIGSTMTWGATVDTSGDACNATTGICLPGTANIAQGGVRITIARASKINGGTSVWISQAGNVVVAVEKIGDGFLFLTGDSNITSGCGYANCEFLKRLASYEDGQII